MKNKLMISLAFAAVLFVAGCDDDDVSKDGDSKPGSWTAKIDGVNWQADIIQKRVNNSGIDFLGYGSADESVMILFFEGDAEVKNYVIPGGASFTYYEVASEAGTGEISMEGEVNVTKYDADSLVATYHFLTPAQEVTEGKIKIKLN